MDRKLWLLGLGFTAFGISVVMPVPDSFSWLNDYMRVLAGIVLIILGMIGMFIAPEV